jgi:hypothetical protein
VTHCQVLQLHKQQQLLQQLPVRVQQLGQQQQLRRLVYGGWTG